MTKSILLQAAEMADRLRSQQAIPSRNEVAEFIELMASRMNGGEGSAALTAVDVAMKALQSIANTNGGSPVDRNNRMKKTARTAIATLTGNTELDAGAPNHHDHTKRGFDPK